ncbi:MAG: ATP-binding protein [Treponema sp.]|nr:ATP-binding protein [Treponema sp.]
MINSVSINNFKIIKNLENVPLKKITLISGKNNIGKTTFLEALFFYLDYNSPEVINKLFSWRMFSGMWVPQKTWEKFFPYSDLSKEIKIIVNANKDVKGQVNIKFLADYETSVPIPVTDENKITTLRKNFPSLEISHYNNESIDYLAHLLCYNTSYNYVKEIDQLQEELSVFYMSERMSLYERNTEYLGILDKADEQNQVLELLKVFEPNLIQLQLINENGNNLIYADLGNRNKIPVNMLGDGFCRCLTMALIIASKNADVLLVDEIGSGIHYSAQEAFWNFLVKAAEQYNCQIIATTHSNDTIKAFSEAINGKDESNFSYIRLGKSKDEIKPYTFSTDILSYSMASELEIR